MFIEIYQNFFNSISDTMSIHCLNLVTTTILRNQNHQLREGPHVYLRSIVFVLRAFKTEEVIFSDVKYLITNLDWVAYSSLSVLQIWRLLGCGNIT